MTGGTNKGGREKYTVEKRKGARDKGAKLKSQRT